MEPKRIKISALVGNNGQIEGLPKNPREWDDSDVERLAESIQETPELAEARPMIVIKRESKYIVLGGNLRLCAWRKLGVKEASCFVLPEDTPIQKMKEIVLKDNSSFGSWDADELANKWDDLPLSEWGVDVAGLTVESSYDGKNTEINTSDWSEDMTLKLKFTEEEIAFVKSYFEGKDAKAELLKLMGYDGNEY